MEINRIKSKNKYTLYAIQVAAILKQRYFESGTKAFRYPRSYRNKNKKCVFLFSRKNIRDV